MARRVVITGVGVVSSLGDTPEALHTALCEGRSGIRPVEAFEAQGLGRPLGADIPSFSPATYLGKKNFRPLDRTSQLAASAAHLALAAGGWSPEMCDRHEVGLVLGTMFCSVRTIAEFDRRALTAGPAYVSPLDFANTVISAASGQTAIWHHLRGVNSTVATGITSGLQALAHATDHIRTGQATALLVGGAEEFCFESFYGFHRAGLLCGSAGGDLYPIPFDARRTGFAPGEGAAFLMLEDAEAAAGRGAAPLAEVRGHGSGFDGLRAKEDEGRSVARIARILRQALADAGMDAGEVDAVSASASGSVREDRREALALAGVFGERASRLPVTAVKAALGETLGASGMMQTAAALEAMRTGVLPGIPSLKGVEDGFPLTLAGPENRRLDLRTCLVNSVGFDGHACAVILVR